MFLKKRKVNGTLYWSLAENYREEGKVKQRVIRSLGPTEKAIKILGESEEYQKFLIDILAVPQQKELEINKIHNMDCLKGLKLLKDNSIDCCVTSPPYWGLRDYGVPGQMGLEATLEEYLKKITEIFREVKRVLKPTGTLWLNLGDSYVGTGGDRLKPVKNEIFQIQQSHNPSRGRYDRKKKLMEGNLKPKDLIGIPWMVAFALRADGWYLRSDIIWHKPNPMPESVKDRPTKSHEYIFLMSKSSKYYYDAEAIKEPVVCPESNTPEDIQRAMNRRRFTDPKNKQKYDDDKCATDYPIGESKKNKRDVWTVANQPCRAAHFATFPPKLIEPCIVAGCPKDGIVLDPFMGSGTTAKVALENQRNFTGFELNPEYIEIEKELLRKLKNSLMFQLKR